MKTPTEKTTAKKPLKKYQNGGTKKSTPKKTNPKSYNESAGSSGDIIHTSVKGPNNYEKTISKVGTGNKPYQMTVRKGGKTNTFHLTKEQAMNQRKVAKKEAGYKYGGTHKTKKVVKKK